MTTKEWLSRGRLLNERINSLLEERQRMFELATSTTKAVMSDKVQTTGNNSMERRMVQYTNYSLLIDKRIDELLVVKQEILNTIGKIENPSIQTLLQLRYVQFLSWSEISNRMNYENRQIYRLHKKALAIVEKVKMS